MFHFSLISDLNNSRSSHRRCSLKKGVLKNFANFTGKQLFLSLWDCSPQASILKNICERLLLQFQSHECIFFIRICLCQNGTRTIAPEKNCLPVRVSVWFRVRISFRVGSRFSLGTIVLEPQKKLRFVFVKIWWKYEIPY